MEYINDGLNYLYAHQDAVFTAGVVTAVFLLILPWNKTGWFDWLILYRRGRMKKKERRELVVLQAVDDFVDAIEERVADESISRTEATELYVMLQRAFPIKSLFPSNQWLKDSIRSRLNNHVTPKLPDKKEKKGRNIFAKV